MSSETSPRAVRFSGGEEDLRSEKQGSRPSSVILDRPVDHAPEYDDYADPHLMPSRPKVTRTGGSHEDLGSLARYPDPSNPPGAKLSLVPPPVNGGSRPSRGGPADIDGSLYMNGSSPRPSRPTGPARTPSSAYAPVRRPIPTNPSFNDHARSSSKTRRGPDQFRDRAYLQRLQQPSVNDYFNEYSNPSGTTYGDSDSDGETPSSESPFDARNEEVIMFYGNDDIQPTEEDLNDPASRERLDWHGMLEAVLTGDVVKQEKKRITNSTEQQSGKQLHRSEELWLGIRSKVCGRHIPVQRKLIEDGRATLDRRLEQVVDFEIKGESEAGKPPNEQVRDIVELTDMCDSFYPSWAALADKHKVANSPEFTEAYEAIMAWHNTNKLINTELSVLKKWVGNDDLDFTKVKERSPGSPSLNDEPSFLDRLMKEDGLKTLYSEADESDRRDGDDYRRGAEWESRLGGNYDGRRPNGIYDHSRLSSDRREGEHKGMFVRISAVIRKSKETLIHNYPAFRKRHLPPYIEELLILMSFPSRLVEEIIKVRLTYARKAKESAQQNPLMLDQMISQFQLILKLAIRMKQEYVAIGQAQAGWDLPPCIDESFDQVVLDGLKYYFKMLNWKLSGNKNTFKEAELLFQEWDFGNHIGSHLQNGDVEAAEQFSSLTYKAFNRLSQTFEKELQAKPKESAADLSKRYKACLDSVRVRQRMLQRFSRMLGENYETASDLSISFLPEKMQEFYDRLIETGHFRVEVPHFEKLGIVTIASPTLRDRHYDIPSLLAVTSKDQFPEDNGDPYVLLIRPESPPHWFGDSIQLSIREQNIDLKRGHIRLCASGSLERLERTRTLFLNSLNIHLDLVVEQRSNIHKVNVRLAETRKVAYKLSTTFMDSVETIRRQTQGKDCQELVQTCFVFATEFGKRSLMYLDSNRKQMNMLKLTKLALDWVSFITDDCIASDRRTFRWAVLALEFAMGMTRGRHMLALGEDEYVQLRTKVSGCMALLISHFDIMGARSMLAAKAEKERSMENLMGQLKKKLDQNRITSDKEAARYTSEHKVQELEKVDELRRQIETSRSAMGRVLETNNEVDRSLAYLSSSATNVTMRWQQGSFIGGGTFGTVYAAVNLDSGQLMAVKEIRLPDPKLIPRIAGQIRDEMGVLEVLDHPNVVSYYGIEVHRDRVYIFMEYCQNGSLANLLEHGRIEDEQVIMVYALQLLEGLTYLHASGIVHRDIKPENILLDHNGIIKYVDFGAAKVFAKQVRSIAIDLHTVKPSKSVAGGGTPMYMSPEVVRGEDVGGQGGAGDIWSIGCVVLEMATGRRPWGNLDNEFAIMYSIAQGIPPPLPTEDQLSPEGIDFLKRCFTRDPLKRATAIELLGHDWMMAIRQRVMEPGTPSDSGSKWDPGPEQELGQWARRRRRFSLGCVEEGVEEEEAVPPEDEDGKEPEPGERGEVARRTV
ncbi:related to MAP kinase kinase kinase Wis4 [Cephalotrichum gorgonifer]|uniref:mitogen-activated protein kinase n=1 Tax=Cephalotrichum gorgonifer TaxID=2041049 RepID=A0AAE8SS18_9PEZI|nr:related to MAP kinase kinase kinase Wis4 [Cephalotrichum gorgonifer]